VSLRLRLALWYGGLAGLLISLVSAYSFAVHGRAHYDATDAALAASAEHVASELARARTNEDRLTALHASLLLRSAARLYGPDSVLRLEWAGLPTPTITLRAALRETPTPYPRVARVAPALHPASHYRGHGTFGLVRDSIRWRVYTRQLDNGEYLMAVAPLSVIDESVTRFGLLMLMMATVGVVLTFLASWLVAASALRPVSLLTQTAGGIARSREFSRRVPVSVRPNGRDELRRLGATFNDMLASLEGAYATQQRFVSDASHELRAPLTSIQANLELLRNRADMASDERERATDEAWREANRLARLVADLLSLARADAGASLRREPVELDRVLMEVIGESRHLASGQHLEIERLEPAVIAGDPDRIKQLLLILVDNAIKYTPEGGRVSVGLTRQGAHAEYTVRDTGIGIPAGDIDRVFERFYRADPARSRDPGGTGLGLPIAAWIVSQHRGSIHLSSEPNRGTTATVRLPVS